MSLFTEISNLQNDFLQFQSAFGPAVVSDADYARARAICMKRNTIFPSRAGVQRLINLHLQQLIVTSVVTPSRALVQKVANFRNTVKRWMTSMRSCLPQNKKEVNVIEEQKTKRILAKVPPLQDPAIVGRETFVRVLEERAKALPTAVVGGVGATLGKGISELLGPLLIPIIIIGVLIVLFMVARIFI